MTPASTTASRTTWLGAHQTGRCTGAKARHDDERISRELAMALGDAVIEDRERAVALLRWAGADHVQKSRYRALLSNCTMNDGILTVTMRSPYGALAKMKESEDWLGVLAEYRTAVLGIML